jgi:hypothetical protein
MTNKEFALSKHFQDTCAKAGIPATKRQASKFRKEKGIVYKLVGNRKVKDAN